MKNYDFKWSIWMLFCALLISMGAHAQTPGTVIVNKLTDPASTGEAFSFYSEHYLTIHSPGSIAGQYGASGATFGPQLDLTGVSGNVEFFNDGSGSLRGCDPGVGFTPGNIALIDRGICSFVDKVTNAENAGAIAVIVVNIAPGLITMGAPEGSTDPGIPVVMITLEDGDLIKAELGAGNPVNITMTSNFGYFELEHGQSKTFTDIPAGVYFLEEGDPFYQGYELTDIIIDDPSGGTFFIGGTLLQIEVSPGETVEVTFVNTYTNENCNLTPQTDSKVVNEEYSLLYTLTYLGEIVPDYPVDFEVESGPNAGTTWSTLTDENGDATFSYFGAGGPGTDLIAISIGFGSWFCETVVEWTPCTPVLEAIADPIVLWPPNHKYKSFSVSDLFIGFDDDCSILTADDVYISSVTSDEEEDAQGNGDGKTKDDMIIAPDCKSVTLRKERQGAGNGRVYTITLAADDVNSGTTGTTTCQVYVPQNNGSTTIDDGMAWEVMGDCNNKSAIAENGSRTQAIELSAYPNPFAHSTTISFTLLQSNPTEIRVFNALGKEVTTLFNENAEAGQPYSVEFNGTGLPKGIYYYHLQSGNEVHEVGKLILVQ